MIGVRKMKIKPISSAILALALTTTINLPVKADTDRNCRIDRNTGVEICENLNPRDERWDRDYRRNNTVEGRIDELYREVLDRRGDRGGLRAYRNRVVRDGWNYARVRQDLARSREATEKIRNMYRGIVGRNPDEDTIRRYQVALERGWSMDRVRDELRNSREARERDFNYRR